MTFRADARRSSLHQLLPFMDDHNDGAIIVAIKIDEAPTLPTRMGYSVQYQTASEHQGRDHPDVDCNDQARKARHNTIRLEPEAKIAIPMSACLGNRDRKSV
jgi:hypothetical protein